MIIDGLLQFSGSVNPVAGQLVTALGNTLSTNVIDTAGVGLFSQPRDLGMGHSLDIAITCLAAVTSGGAATVGFQLVEADDAAISVNVQVIVQTDAIPVASLTLGTIVPLHYDRAAPYPARRYIALRYVVGTAVLTNATGQFFAGIVNNLQDRGNNTIYQNGFTVA